MLHSNVASDLYLNMLESDAIVQLTFICGADRFWELLKMNNAKLYKKSNSLQKRDAQEIMDEFSHLFKDDAQMTLLDIGCGAGDVLVEVILPRLHSKALEVVGADISKEMVNYATEKYRSKFLKFLRVDIESDFLSVDKLTRPARVGGQLKPESFSFITSFYCLHWIQNQR